MEHIWSLKTLSKSLEKLAPSGLKPDSDLTLPHTANAYINLFFLVLENQRKAEEHQKDCKQSELKARSKESDANWDEPDELIAAKC